MLERNTWILVADGERARLFRNESPQVTLKPAFDHEFIGDQREARDIASDEKGRQRSGTGPEAGPPAGGPFRRQTYDQQTDPKDHEKHRFLKRTAEVLEDGLERNAYHSLVLVAPPQALGELRDNLSKKVADSIVYEYNKDLTKERVDDLEERLRSIFLPV